MLQVQMSLTAEVAGADRSSRALEQTSRSLITVRADTASQSNRRVVMLVANEFTHDTRVYKQARSLMQWGCEVHIIAMARADLPRTENLDGIQVHRLEVKASRCWRIFVAMLFWWCLPLLRRITAPASVQDHQTVAQQSASGTSATSKMKPQKDRVSESSSSKTTSAIWREIRIAAIVARRLMYRITRIIRRLVTSLMRAVRKLLPGVAGLFSLNFDMTRLAVALNPAVVQSHDLNTLMAGGLVKRLSGAKLVYDSHELFLERNIASKSRWKDRLAWAPVERVFIGYCDAVMSVAEGICLHLAKRYRISKPHLLRNVQPYESPPQRSRILSDELGIEHSKAIVIYPGAITINRGLEAMIDSAPLLENAVYVVMGYARNPKYMAQLKDRAQRLGVLNTKLFFREAVPIDQVVRYTASADLGIVPTQNVCLSYYFEASNKIFHCLMAGVPLAMSDHHEKRLIAQDFGVGVLFDETDPRKIAAAVNSAIADRERYDRMRANCFKAARLLNWEHEEHGLRCIFAGLLGPRALPVPLPKLPEAELICEPKSNGAHQGEIVVVKPISRPTRSIFDDPAALRKLCAMPADPSTEPGANFPLGYYEAFLDEIHRLEIEVVTFADLFANSDDWDYRSNYAAEFKHWHKHVRHPRKRYLLIQHDVDNHPHFTQRMVAMEALHGVRSNIFVFNKRYSERFENPPYDIDHAFFEQAQQRGFVIGYHQNALQLAGFDVVRAQDQFRADVAELRKRYDIQFMVPHGGLGREINGRMHHNIDVPLPPEFEGPSGRLRWVFNKYGPSFSMRWSDGGLRKLRDPGKLANMDLIKSFLYQIKPGTRAFCLIHPQRWGFNVQPLQNPVLANTAWYSKVCQVYSPMEHT
jgi:glycosyltransferase involved in cell wall biosynthesis